MTSKYKVKRSTAVLALHSAAIRTRSYLLPALEALRAQNYDYERLPDETLQALFAGLDEDFTKQVLAEFRFIAKLGAVRDHRACVAICNLCGKGDSRDDGANSDHLRYEFRLTNTEGGSEVWTGSTCIINHALKVDGAGNADEARRILEKSFREHMALWRIEQWQALNPDHKEIPLQWDRFRTTPRDVGFAGRFENHGAELSLLGFDFEQIRKDVHTHYRRFRAAVRKYQRDGHLGFGKGLEPSQKQSSWERAKELLRDFIAIDQALNASQQLTDPDEKIALLIERREQLTQEAAGRAAATCPPRRRQPRTEPYSNEKEDFKDDDARDAQDPQAA